MPRWAIRAFRCDAEFWLGPDGELHYERRWKARIFRNRVACLAELHRLQKLATPEVDYFAEETGPQEMEYFERVRVTWTVE